MTGVDYAGPVYVKDGTETVKRYIALKICVFTGAFHLEITKDLSTEAFRLTPQYFSARRSYPQLLVSVNDINFGSCAKILTFWEEHHSVRGTLNQDKCKRQFIQSQAPWFGDSYGRIGSY